MKWLFVLSAVFCSSFAFSQSKFSIKVLQSSGSIEDLSNQSKAAKWNLKSKVADRLHLVLGPEAQTKIQLSPQIVLTAYGPSEFEIPFIAWETRQFKNLKLQKGAVRLEVKDQVELELETPFYKLQPPPGQWVFMIDPERALADIMALKGSLEVTSLNSEDKVSLQTGEKTTFRGVLEEGEIAYDLLLQGRKIPKGKWDPAEKLSQADKKAFSLEDEEKRMALLQKQKALAAKAELKKQAGETCTKPSGELGECIWKREEGQCIRTRCAADGKWKDPQPVGMSFCDKASGWSPRPQKCDY